MSGRTKAFLLIGISFILGFSITRLDRIGIVTSVGTMAQRGNDYNVRFEIKDVNANLNVYALKYVNPGLIQAHSIADSFEMTYDYDDDRSYFYKNDDGTLRVDKFVNSLVYKRTAPPSDYAPSIYTYDDYINIALDFMKTRLIYLSYEDILTEYYSFDDEISVSVSFVTMLDGMKNYAVMSQVTMNEVGDVLECLYYFGSYERLGTRPQKSVEQAISELPKTDCRIILEECQLVYFYENSIVQPAYLFIGKEEGGQLFECLVSAVTFN